MPKRILLAEDDPKDAELILTALDEYNLSADVRVVRDGAEALDYLHRRGAFAGLHPGNPVVILLDLKMPKKDGLDVIRQIRENGDLRAIPVVILSSSREALDLKSCYELGVNAYVVKPLKFSDFLEAVRHIGAFWALINEPPPGSLARAP